MTWFKVDDAFHTSRKVMSIPKRQRFAAVGLWTIAGSWCSQEKTDGFVPEHMIQEWGATEKLVASLVDSGLWERTRGGFAFRSWLEYNPSKAQIDDERAASKARMRASRERKRNKMAGQSNAGSDVAEQHQRNGYDVMHCPDPTRPDISSTYVEKASHVGTAGANDERRPTGPAVDVDGWKLIRDVIPAEHPQASRTMLAMEAGALLKSGTPAADVRDALALWLTKPHLGPRTLPSLVSEVIRNRHQPPGPAFSRPGTAVSTADQRVAQAQALKNTPGAVWPGGPLELT